MTTWWKQSTTTRWSGWLESWDSG